MRKAWGQWSSTGAQRGERIEGDNNGPEHGVPEQSWPAPARAAWLRRCALAVHRGG